MRSKVAKKKLDKRLRGRSKAKITVFVEKYNLLRLSDSECYIVSDSGTAYPVAVDVVERAKLYAKLLDETYG